MTFRRWLFYTLFYLRRPPWDTGVTPPEVVDFVRSAPPGRALDLGCGTGTNALYLAQHGWQATGIDFVGRAIQRAQRLAPAAGGGSSPRALDFRVGDVTRLDDVLDQASPPFDLILDIGCYHSLTPAGQAAYRANLDRWLAPQGTLLLYAFTLPDDDSPGSGVGLRPAQVAALQSGLRLAQRQDGSDRSRPSAWFTFHPHPRP